MSRNRWAIIILAFIIAVSAVLHLMYLSYPDKPVFDEAHFSTYAADYVQHRAFYDMHPPLGKLIYAAALVPFSKNGLGDSQFISVNKPDLRRPESIVSETHQSFNRFPYVLLRIVSSFFGILLILVFYLFLRVLGMGNRGALLAALFLVLENAFLVQTRLIFLDGMYLVFGIGALALYFYSQKHDQKVLSFAAGVLWGLSLGIKLTSIVFIVPLVVDYWIERPSTTSKKRMFSFILTGCIVLLLICASNFLFFSAHDQFAVLHSYGLPMEISSNQESFSSYALVSGIGAMYSIGNYLVGPAHIAQSPWYMWPVMQIPIPYYGDASAGQGRQIIFEGNPVIWFLATIAVIIGIALIPRFIRKSENASRRILFILLSGYIGSLLPFVFIIRRSTFLYHYLPAYLFAIGLLAWFLDQFLNSGDGRFYRQKVLVVAAIILFAIAGFCMVLPVTYGL